MRISAYQDLPFAILRYDPVDEWKVHREAPYWRPVLGDIGKQVQLISLADLLLAGCRRDRGWMPSPG